MRQTFGEDLVGAVMFGILSGHRSNEFHLRIDPNRVGDRRMIEAIKEIRSLTGLGLKESKDLVETSIERDVVFRVDRDLSIPLEGERLDRSIRALESAGFNVT